MSEYSNFDGDFVDTNPPEDGPGNYSVGDIAGGAEAAPDHDAEGVENLERFPGVGRGHQSPLHDWNDLSERAAVDTIAEQVTTPAIFQDTALNVRQVSATSLVVTAYPVTGVPVQVAQDNPDRLSLRLYYDDTKASVYVGANAAIVGAAAAGPGFLIPAGVVTDIPTTSAVWVVTSTGAGVRLSVLELVRSEGEDW